MINKKGSRFIVIALLLLLVQMLTACGAASAAKKVAVDAAGEHDKLVTLYWDATTAQSTFGACVDTQGQKVRASTQTMVLLLDAEEQRVINWKQDVNTESKAFADAQNAYNEANDIPVGTPVNLDQMQANGGDPATVYSGMALQIEALTEAPLPTLGDSSAVALANMATINEASDTIFGCILDWNEAAKAYNIERATIDSLTDSGRIIGDAANELGFTSLPRELKMYESASSNEPVGDFFTE